MDWLGLISAVAPSLALIIIAVALRMRPKSGTVSLFGQEVDLERKQSAKTRSRLQTLHQAKALQQRIDDIAMHHDLKTQMSRVEDELDAAQAAHEAAFRKKLKEQYPDIENVHRTMDYRVYVLIWERLRHRLRDKIRDSFVVNGFHDYDEEQLNTYVKNKLNVFWTLATGLWDHLWPTEMTVSRSDISSCGEESRMTITIIMHRLYSDVQKIRRGHTAEIEEMKVQLKELEGDLE